MIQIHSQTLVPGLDPTGNPPAAALDPHAVQQAACPYPPPGWPCQHFGWGRWIHAGWGTPPGCHCTLLGCLHISTSQILSASCAFTTSLSAHLLHVCQILFSMQPALAPADLCIDGMHCKRSACRLLGTHATIHSFNQQYKPGISKSTRALVAICSMLQIKATPAVMHKNLFIKTYGCLMCRQ